MAISIGGVRVDLQLNSAAFIRDIAKTNAAIAGSTRQMTSQLTRLQKASQAVAATFGAWVTVRATKKVINFLDQSIDLAAKLDTTLGNTAKQFQSNAEAMSNAFKLGVAEGFISILSVGVTDVTARLQQLANAGIIVGKTLGGAFMVLVDVFTILLPEAFILAARGMNAFIGLINSAISAFNALNETINNSWFGKFQGFTATGGNLGLIPTIDVEGLKTGAAAFFGLADGASIATSALNLTTQATEAHKKATEDANRLQREQQALFNSIATPMEQYAMAVKAIADAHVEGEMAARLHQAAVANLVGNYLQLADNVGTALGIVFKDSKAVAIAQAVINTAQAIMKTFAEYGATPWGFALAASMAAIGAAQIAAIVSAQPGGGSKATKKTSGGAGKTAPAKAGAASTASGAGAPGQAVNITLVGEGGFNREQVRALIGQINDAVGDGATLRVSG